MLNVCIVGLGVVGKAHLKAYGECRNVNIVALCDNDPSVTEELYSSDIATYLQSSTQIFDDFDEMIAAVDFDVMSIASYDAHHGCQTVKALRSGAHVFCEKPICTSVDEYLEILDIVNSNPSLQITTNTLLRSSPLFLEIKDLIQTGVLGDLYWIDCEYQYGRFEKIKYGWRGTFPDYSVMLGGGIHMIDLALWYLGGRVTSVIGISSSINSNREGLPFPDISACLLEFDTGAVAKISANFACIAPHHHQISVFGSRGTVKNIESRPIRYGRESERFIDSVMEYELKNRYSSVPKGALIRHFLNQILGVGGAVVSAKDALDTVAVALACDQAISSNTRVVVDF